jgi:putative membrane protein insertion efficiency factor
MTTTASPPTTTPAPLDDVLEVPTARLRQPWSRRGSLFLLRAYQGAASGRVSMCRYYPSCSNYAVEAFSVHGFWRAFGLTARRLLRCRPFGPHGIDLVPLPDGAVSTATHECEAGRGQVSTAKEVHQPC